jgi:hypothetical protein
LGIRFPNAKIWVLGAPPPIKNRLPGMDPLTAWARHSAPGQFEALVLPTVEPVDVNTLEPLLLSWCPRSVVMCHRLRDSRESKDFRRFFSEYRVDIIAAGDGWRFVPVIGCTLTVCTDRPPISPCELIRPATFRLSFYGRIIIFSPDNADTTQQALENVFLLDRARIGAQRFFTESDGAISIHISRNGRMTAETMRSRFLAAMGIE